MGLGLGIALEFFTSVTIWLKLKVRKFWGLSPTFAEVNGKQLVGGGLPPSWIGLINNF